MSLLGQLKTPAADQRLLEELRRLANGPSDPALRLEVYLAGLKRAAENSQIAATVKTIDTARAAKAATDPLAAFDDCLSGGDAAVGRNTFMTHLAAQCIRCHKLDNKGSTVGPALDDVGKTRDVAYLLRSIVSPSADIDPKYRSQVIILESGKTVIGLMKEKTETELVLVDTNRKEVRIPLDSIDDIEEQKISIMPLVTEQLSRREIRDLVAFLRTLKK